MFIIILFSFIYAFDIYGDCSNYHATFWGEASEKYKTKDDMNLQEKETGFISQ